MTKRRPEKQRKNWLDAIRQDIKEIDIFWERKLALTIGH